MAQCATGCFRILKQVLKCLKNLAFRIVFNLKYISFDNFEIILPKDEFTNIVR